MKAYPRVLVFRWQNYSKGAKLLAKSLGVPVINTSRSMSFPANPVVINWGSSGHPVLLSLTRQGVKIINDPDKLSVATNKKKFFEAVAASKDPARIPVWTSSPLKAMEWHEQGKEVCARLKLQSHSGIGLEFFSDHHDDLEPLLQAHLYTQYIRKKHEYRVHIFGDEVIDHQRKMLRKADLNGHEVDPKTIDWRIRNMANGFVYGDRDSDMPGDVLVQAKKAFAVTGLDFGAVDVLWADKEQKAYVLEVNTAPGLTGTTLENYVVAFKKYFAKEGIMRT